MGCNCNKGVTGYVVKIPGQPDRQVSTEQAAIALTRPVSGATYTPVKK